VYDSADIAVAVNTPAGLITPVIRSAETKGLATISRELKALTDRARAGQLRPEEYTGGTFTISNLGMYGVTSLYPIVNPPQSCILGVGAAIQRPVVRDGAVTVGTVMSCTLSADHRALDGATGAELLAEFRRLIEHPWLLMV
jgi:pyruvate dehydrogenase E2 component (dihydrolipoamide acetyltransferase)